MKNEKKVFLMVFKQQVRNIFLCILLFFALVLPEVCVRAEEVSPATLAPSEIHALSAVLMDGESGRVLYDKEGAVKRANASTTKILTCILTLESCQEDEVVSVSEYAASMPNVQLGINAGEYYYLRDLLYSLMLESHNDSAVAIAEHVAGSTQAFAEKMNEKAAQLGCRDSHFITPNGLDATDEIGFHGTTAQDLARIMAYCAWNSPMSARFLELTETRSHSFSNLSQQADGTYTPGGRSFTCGNRNAYLQQDNECITGKTGFTGDAGYCYVCAVDSQGRKFVVALLASGWPNNKNYKWQDCNKLFAYGRSYYHIREIPQFTEELKEIRITESANPTWDLRGEVTSMPYMEECQGTVLMADWEHIHASVSYPKEIQADKRGIQTIGEMVISLEEQPLMTKPIYVNLPNDKRNLEWYFQSVIRHWTRFSLETDDIMSLWKK